MKAPATDSGNTVQAQVPETESAGASAHDSSARHDREIHDKV